MHVALIFATVLQVAASQQPEVAACSFRGAAAERFLKDSQIVAVGDFDSLAVTKPKKVELTDGHQTCFALFKTIDERASVKRFANGSNELRFSDRYTYEIAAYELDKLLDLGIVPPTVERRISREVGSLSLWIEDTITEWERHKVRNVHPPDLGQWNHQMFTVRLFQQLIYDTDYRNTNNLLVTPDWKIYKIDSSRAFRTHKCLRREASLTRFSRSVLDSLRRLSKEQLKEHLRPWLSNDQVEALWVRRNLVLELADRRIAEFGEDAVLFD